MEIHRRDQRGSRRDKNTYFLVFLDENALDGMDAQVVVGSSKYSVVNAHFYV